MGAPQENHHRGLFGGCFKSPSHIPKTFRVHEEAPWLRCITRPVSLSPRPVGHQKKYKKEEKTAVITAIGKRNRPGGRVSDVEIRQGDFMKPVDSKQVKRFINDTIRHHSAPPLTPGIISQWNLPYAAYRASLATQDNHASPFSYNPPTPQYLHVNSPDTSAGRGEISDIITPTSALIQRKTLLDRSSLLLQGRREELLSGCNSNDRRTISDWLHDYWMYCFMTAKFWGVGPQEWTAGLISEVTIGLGVTETPDAVHSMSPFASVSNSLPQETPLTENPRPTDLCRWVIHHEDTVDFDDDSTPPLPPMEQATFELGDQSSWTEWPTSQTARSYQSTIQEALTSSRFSAIAPNEVPISNEVVAEVISKSLKQIALDSWAFAIMTGNVDLLTKLRHEAGSRPDLDFAEIHPYHLAASYVDGGNICCLVLCCLTKALDGTYPIALKNLDSNGHTVLDALMISILRSHTDCPPVNVSTSFVDCTRFPGEEKDICGRWDADSPAIRHLYRSGQPQVPTHWKHAFCHSSVQAICHNMIAIFLPPSAPDINAYSGLFRRRCTSCGLEMKLGSLHTLVAVAFHLAENGKNGETLFGAMACLVCLLALGADAAQVADLSVLDMFSSPGEGSCYHRPMTAMELAEEVPQEIKDDWRPSCKIGWRCLVLILRHATPSSQGDSPFIKFSKRVSTCQDFERSETRENENPNDDEDHVLYVDCLFEEFHESFGTPINPNLGTLWAAIQTEVHSYRKVTNLDPNISDHFQVSSLLKWLEEETDDFETPLLREDMMQRHTPCG
ncbi:hypothetical protein BDP55DRAFT_581499 [Colletotrichum godetiae]|uniref:Uncharacterized protein n=1 Tax=Colletotrichum godetiae TaxID=1209918 RepID=A0AAJ0ALW7_9PEZI|nr:uncharacterized protein BDP55DRAFT_581499 [Colletotrichum godetiae]KAK1676302.1 hypothetical protein BDP55DRAFT_581499 [Colletotrichum godetiae]